MIQIVFGLALGVALSAIRRAAHLSQLLTVQEAADFLRCNEDHVYRLLDEGELTGENHALKLEGKTSKGRARQRYIRIHRQSAIDFRRRRQVTQSPVRSIANSLTEPQELLKS